ncbi:MAG TPA: (d)CMP kinase [Clostridia bacterium]
MYNRISIAIDGPAGAGKSTIAKMVSKDLNILYLDTGAMYRAVALKAIRNGIDTLDAEGLSLILKSIDLKIEHIKNEQLMFLDGENVTDFIRTPEVSIGASNVGSIPEVRIKMVELQRLIAKEKSVVMDGRDIGTYVLPNADLKIFLTASLEERARRRYLEQVQKGNMALSYDKVLKDIEYRDKNDSERSFAPLKKAEDAVLIDTTGLSIDDVVKRIIDFADDIKK